tara:strand:- start:1214 stop:1396 length:183 start_codon:yes stop_codon:yes gene_type:complete
MFEWITNLISIVTTIVCAASFIAAVTNTPKDDELLGKFYKAIELLALNIGKAKMLPPNKN